VLTVPHDHPLAFDDGPLGAREFAAAAGEMTWLCAPERHPSRVAGDRRLHDLGVRPRRFWEFEGLATIAALVGGGTGCALLPETVARTQPSSRVAIRRLSPPMTRRIQVLTRAGARQNPAVRACTSAITTELEREAPA
jgi:DNA-binding transcriptional LysR family regulator